MSRYVALSLILVRWLAWNFLAISFLLVAASTSSALQLASSTFDVDDEGWRVVGDAQSSLPSYITTGGNPGPFLRGFDQTVGGVWVWSAPAKFLGNKSAAYGFALTYDLRMRGSGPLFDDSDVILTGSSLSLYRQLTPPVPQDVTWTSYSALLSETAAWHTTSLSGPLATAAQIKSVLGNLSALQIRGEFISGPDNGDLDNVVLNGALLGDYNANGTVDASDYVMWRKFEDGVTPLANDGGLGTPIGAAHYNLWRTNFGQSSANGTGVTLGATTTIPEPCPLALFSIAVSAVSLSIRRR